MSSTFVVIIILQSLIAFSVIDVYGATIYYYSLVAMLFLAVVQFARLILARPDASLARAEEG